ncbi:MAG: DUF4340 domain-containing protein [Alphaproteobacteria bacterium]|nr:DUF4340 domain-containing protein [Alphaproteobacteria bacterium]
MNADKILKITFIVFALSVVLAFVAVGVTMFRYPTQSHGKLVFEKAYENVDGVDKIEILSHGNITTLMAQNGRWVVKEADGYFANIKYLNSLMTDFNKSTYYAKQEFSEENLDNYDLTKNAVTLKLYDDDKLLDEVILGKAVQNNIFHFMKPADENEIWLIDGTYNLPREFYSWIVQPVMELPVRMVEKIKTDDIVLQRYEEGMPFVHKMQIYENVALLNYAKTILAENVLNADNFAKLKIPQVREITFIIFQGLVINYKLYSQNDEYWLNINLSTTSLPKTMVNDYIKDNNIFFENWYFKLPQDQGRELMFTPLI